MTCLCVCDMFVYVCRCQLQQSITRKKLFPANNKPSETIDSYVALLLYPYHSYALMHMIHMCRCQPQSITSNPLWTPQDLAVLGIIFGPCWDNLKEIDSSAKPGPFKASSARKIVLKHWNQCGLRLQKGVHIKEGKHHKHQFDGSSVLQLVAEYRSRTKERTRFITQLKHGLELHYASLPEVYQPIDKSEPLHKHWGKARLTFRPPPIPRTTMMRQVIIKYSVLPGLYL